MKQVNVKICELSEKHAKCEHLVKIGNNDDRIQICRLDNDYSSVDSCYYKKSVELTIRRVVI